MDINLTRCIKYILVLMICSINISYAQTEGTPNQTSNSATLPVITRDLTPAEDQAITDSIKKQIRNSKTLSRYNIDVSTQNGVVTLSGEVDSNTQASTLIEMAQSVIGTKDIKDQDLKVKDGHQILEDTVITAKIKGLFIREKVFGTKDIAAINLSIETKDGIVYLSGYVDNQEQLKNAISLVKQVEGVKKVEYNVDKLIPNS